MSTQKLSRAVAVLTILAATPFMLATRASAQQEKVLHSFNSTSKVGTNPDSPLIFDSAGNLYGTTGLGGAYNGGSLFELTPAAGGRWTIKVLHEFGNGTDGKTPYGNLIFDAAGNLYGVTAFGGPNSGGTAFELSPQAGGIWRETILHSFNSSATDGNSPTGGLVFGVSSNLYGTTNGGGADNTGIVFALSPAAGGTWTETILHSFGNNSTPDGQQPYLVQLVIDVAGNLYGTTEYGGAFKSGTVFEISPAAGGSWTESVLHSFNPATTEGYSPSSGLTVDASGNLYGTAYFGGANNAGSLFKLSPLPGGGWKETAIYDFKNDGIDGRNPAASLIIDKAGHLYGTAFFGGAYGYGAAFELTRKAGGGWTEKQLHSFNNNGSDAYYPFVPLTLSSAGILFGTTNGGGLYSAGTIFEIKP